ncbi:MAG TPA: hypothetical protein DDW87_06220 [Firmicutes bacterium]|nr:hypothetical protein [Bacillota bacterium]
MKGKLLVAVAVLLVLATVFGWYYSRGAFTLDDASVWAAEREIRDALSEYTSAIKARDARSLAEVMSYPANMGGVVIRSKSGFISRMSQAFRIHIDEIVDLAYVVKSIDVKPRRALAELDQTITIVGYFGQPVELRRTIYMNFRKIGDTWKVADSGQSDPYDGSILARLADSPLTIPAILLTVLIIVGYIDSRTTY